MISINKLDGFIGETERIILELDLDDPKELQDFAKLTALPKDKSLTDYLTKEQVSKVDEMTKDVLGITTLKALKIHTQSCFKLCFFQAKNQWVATLRVLTN